MEVIIFNTYLMHILHGDIFKKTTRFICVLEVYRDDNVNNSKKIHESDLLKEGSVAKRGRYKPLPSIKLSVS